MPACTSCGASALESHESSLVCANCGLVYEESAIVSDVTFGENSVGGAVVQGSYVGSDQTAARTMGPGGFRAGGGESRQQTIARARGEIQRISNGLNVPGYVAEKAVRFYTLALSGGSFQEDDYGRGGGAPKNFVLGRRAEFTLASCIYAACRKEKTSHMLIDFAEAIDVNVFTLGRSYLRLLHCLHLKMDFLDPTFYIARFAALLDFGTETRKVIDDASRLVRRFHKDWITDGRRPAGIAGAALLLAARMNHFRRSVVEVVQVVKMADITLRKRLDEFRQTPSGRLSIDDFRKVWFEEENEPPSVYLARLPKREPREKKGRPPKKGSVKPERGGGGGGGGGTPSNRNQPDKVGEASAKDADPEERQRADGEAQGDQGAGDDADADAESDAEEDRRGGARRRKTQRRGALAKEDPGGDENDDNDDDDNEVEDDREEDDDGEGAPQPPVNEEAERLAEQAAEEQITRYLDMGQARELGEHLEEEERRRLERARSGRFGSPDSGAAGGEPAREAAVADGTSGEGGVAGESEAPLKPLKQSQSQNARPPVDGDGGGEDSRGAAPSSSAAVWKRSQSAAAAPASDSELAGLDEEELDALLLSPEEVRIKERVWMEFNRDYLERALERQLKMEADIKAGVRPRNQKRKKKKPPRDGTNPLAASAAEATVQMMKKKSFSKKINYDAIVGLFPGSSGASSSRKRSRSHSRPLLGQGAGGDASSGKRRRHGRAEGGGEDADRSGRHYFSEEASEMEVVEEDDETPSNHASRRRESREDSARRQRQQRGQRGGANSQDEAGSGWSAGGGGGGHATTSEAETERDVGSNVEEHEDLGMEGMDPSMMRALLYRAEDDDEGEHAYDDEEPAYDEEYD